MNKMKGKTIAVVGSVLSLLTVIWTPTRAIHAHASEREPPSDVSAGRYEKLKMTADTAPEAITGTATTGAAIGIPQIKIKASTKDYEEKEIELEWEETPDAVRYEIDHKDNGEWQAIGYEEGERATITIPGYASAHTYQICAYDADDILIGRSASVELVLPKKIQKTGTTSLSTSRVRVYWHGAKGANAYKVYQKKPGGSYSHIRTTKKTYARLNVSEDKKYRFKIIPIYKSGLGTIQSASAEIVLNNSDPVSLGHQRYSYAEMLNDIKSMQKKYSEYLSYEAIGRSVQGRKIYDVILGDPDAEDSLLVVCSLHAREYVTTATCMKQLEYYLKNYNRTIDGKKPSDLFRKCCVHYVMMADPDGVRISQTRNSTWKGNAHGVNLNRNFSHGFISDGSVSGNTYSGKHANSEPETRAIVSITKELKKKHKRTAVVNYHAMGNIVFGGYHGRNSQLKNRIDKMYRTARSTTGYADSSSYSASSDGNYRSYLNYIVKIPSITLEVGSASCPVPQYHYPSIYERNKLVVLREAALVSGS